MTVDEVLALLAEHLGRVGADEVATARAAFRERGFVKVGFLAPPAVTAGLAAEVEELVGAHGVRRDLVFAETGGTPRRMRNVRRLEIHRHGRLVPALYRSTVLRVALGRVAGEGVLECPYQPEQYVITELAGAGDTHGWHWDDYSFALVWVIDCPPLAEGGFVQCVPKTRWNKADPQLHRQFVERPIHSMELRPGELYLMRTDTTLHRVYPIRSGRRLIVNMAYASAADLDKDISHDTMDSLWASR